MRITLDIQDNKFETFLNFLKTLDYVSINEDENVPQWQQDEVNRRIELLNTGKMKVRTWNEAKSDIFRK